MNIVRRVAGGVLAAAALLVGTAAGAGAAPPTPTPVTVDFSTPGQGVFDPSFFAAQGVVFTSGTFVGFVQGDDALVPGPVAGRFVRPVSSLSVRVAPAYAGTSEFTLDAFDRSGRRIARARTTVVQDAGDPATGPFGYLTMQLGSLRNATSFRLSTRLVRSSSPNITTMELGLASLTFTPARCAK